MTRKEAGVAQYAFDVAIAAPIDRVWGLLTSDLSTWWPAHFCSSPDTQRFVLEPMVGGRLYEDEGNGDGVLWGTVVHIKTGQRLQIQGAMFPEYGGPGTFILSLSLEKVAEGCLLKVTDSQFGYISDEQLASTESGWKEIFELLRVAAES